MVRAQLISPSLSICFAIWKIGLQRSFAADVGSAAMKSAAKWVNAVKGTRNHFTPEGPQQVYHWLFGLFHDCCSLVEHEDVHRYPVAHISGRRAACPHGRRCSHYLPVVDLE